MYQIHNIHNSHTINYTEHRISPAFGIGFQKINTRDVGPRGV
jgi:hypothetical protein